MKCPDVVNAACGKRNRNQAPLRTCFKNRIDTADPSMALMMGSFSAVVSCVSSPEAAEIEGVAFGIITCTWMRIASWISKMSRILTVRPAFPPNVYSNRRLFFSAAIG